MPAEAATPWEVESENPTPEEQGWTVESEAPAAKIGGAAKATPSFLQAAGELTTHLAKQAVTTGLGQVLENAKAAITGTEPRHIPTVTEHYENVRDFLADTQTGRDFREYVSRVPGGRYATAGADALAKGVTGILDFLTTPAGMATAGIASVAHPIARGAIGASFSATQAPEAVKRLGEFAKNPSPETFGPAVGSTALAVAPVAHAIGRIPAEIEAKIDAHNAAAAQLIEQDRAAGMKAMPELENQAALESGRPQLGAPMAVQTANGPVTVTETAKTPKRGSFYTVTDEARKVVHGGSAETVSGYLRQQGARPLAEAEPGATLDPEATRKLVRFGILDKSQGDYLAQHADELNDGEIESVNKAARMLDANGATYPQSQPRPAIVEQVGRTERAPKVEIPETGTPERVSRVQDARERLAQELTGKPLAEASNPERLAIDQFVTEGYGFSVKPTTAPPGGEVVQQQPSAKTEEPWVVEKEAPSAAPSPRPVSVDSGPREVPAMPVGVGGGIPGSGAESGVSPLLAANSSEAAPAKRVEENISRAETLKPKVQDTQIGKILAGADRTTKIGGESFTEQDPRALHISRALTPEDAEEIDALMAQHGAVNPRFLAGGFDHSVIDLGNGHVMKLGKVAPTSAKNDFTLDPIESKTIGNVGVEVYPKLDTANITGADARHVIDRLANQGLEWTDAGTYNLGRDAQGNLKILDGTVVRKAVPSVHGSDTGLEEPAEVRGGEQVAGGAPAPSEHPAPVRGLPGEQPSTIGAGRAESTPGSEGGAVERPAPQPEEPQSNVGSAEAPRKFSSTQVNLPADVGKYTKAYVAHIPDKALAEDGRETEPHVTVKYGLHQETPEGVAELLKGEGPITVKFGKTSIFPAAETETARGGAGKFDVLKIDVESPDLHRLNRKIAALPHTDTHPTYQPHVTLAYLKPGEGAKWAGKTVPGVTGRTVTLDRVTFSPHEGEKTEIPLKKRLATAARKVQQPEGVQSGDGRPATETGTGRESGVSGSSGPSAQSRYGDSVQVRIPGENRAFDSNYAIRELGDVVPSHNPLTLQPNPKYPFRNDRNYADQRNAERIIKQVAEFDPNYLVSDTPNATDGGPVIDRDGNVLGGNSRAITMARIYKQRPEQAKAYRDLLTKKAAQFGLTAEDVAEMKEPLLVRELSRELSPDEVQPAITDLNKVVTAALSISERAIADSGRISAETLEQLGGMIDRQGPTGTLAEALSGKGGAYIVDRLIKDGVLTTQEKPNLFDDHGSLTASAKDRISKLMIGRVFEDSAQFESAPPSLRNKLERIVAPLSRLAGKPDWDLLPDVREAVKMLEEARATGTKNLDDLVAQQGLFSAGAYAHKAIALAKVIDKNGPVRLSQAFNRYANDSSGPTMFGDVSPEDAFADAFEQDSERGSISPELLTAGLNRFVEQDVVPAAKDAAATLLAAADDLLKIALPTARGGPQTAQAAEIMRYRMSELAHRMDQAMKAVARARSFFEKKGDEFGKDFILEYFSDETGTLPQTGNAELDTIARTIRKLNDDFRDEVQALGTGKLQNYYTNYFAHIWKDSKKTEAVFASFFGRKPLEGPKSFLKKRTHINFKDALDAGLEPVSWNPIDLTMMKLSEMGRYVMAHKVLDDWKASGIARFVDARAGKAASGWRKIDDPIGAVWGQSIQNITEYPNEAIYGALLKTAEALGVTHIRGFKNLHGAVGRASEGGKTVRTLHGTSEQVLAHEIGHQIDWLAGSGTRFLKYGSVQVAADIKQARQMLSDKTSGPAQRQQARQVLKGFRGQIKQQAAFNKELRALADLRGGPRSYTHKREEKMALLAEMWVGAREQFESTAPKVFAEWKRFLADNPNLHQLRDIEGGVSVTPISQPYDVGGLVLAGNWYAPEGAARILNNHLTPGLLGKSGIYRSILGLNNVLQQFQLGLSGFHVGFTTAEVVMSRAALGFEQILRGRPVKGIGTLASSPLATFQTILKGDKVLKEWYSSGTQGPIISRIVAQLELAGGRAKTDRMYMTQIGDRMLHAFRNGNWFGGLVRSPFALVESVTNLIMREVVPRQKLGVFAELAAWEMERLGPNATFEETRTALTKAWDSVDNRLGLMTYDNLFWDRTAKDIAMLGVRSVGWNLGTLREIGGGAADVLKIPFKLAGGKPPKDMNLHRVGYLLAIATIPAIMGAMYQYLKTGHGPDELKDYYFPKDGELDARGRPQRVSPPTYIPQLYEVAVEPKRTALNKLAPIWGLMGEMWRNQDFYGNEIRNPDDPLIKQMLQEIEHVDRTMEPISARNIGQQSKEGGPISRRVETFFGARNAPSVIEQTKAERIAQDLAAAEIPEHGRTSEQAARREAETTVSRLARSGKDYANQARDYVASGVLTAKDIHEAAQRSATPALIRQFQRLPVQDALRVWAAATPEEKGELRPMLLRKFQSAKKLPPAQQQVVLPKIVEALGSR